MASQLTYGQLEELWIKAGGSRALAPLMAAIAEAESAGNPNATNPTDNGGTQTSWGLWQISDGTHGEPVQGILDPLVNAKAAVAKYKSQGLSAWGTYDTGAYKRYYQGKVPPGQLPAGGRDFVIAGNEATDPRTVDVRQPGQVEDNRLLSLAEKALHQCRNVFAFRSQHQFAFERHHYALRTRIRMADRKRHANDSVSTALRNGYSIRQ